MREPNLVLKRLFSVGQQRQCGLLTATYMHASVVTPFSENCKRYDGEYRNSSRFRESAVGGKPIAVGLQTRP